MGATQVKRKGKELERPTTAGKKLKISEVVSQSKTAEATESSGSDWPEEGGGEGEETVGTGTSQPSARGMRS